MAVISLSGTSCTFTPTANPQYGSGYARNKIIMQPQGYAGSDFYSYTHGERNGRSFTWNMMPATDVDRLRTFLNSVNGSGTFVLVDYDASTYSARVANFGAVQYQNIDGSYYEITLKIEVIS